VTRSAEYTGEIRARLNALVRAEKLSRQDIEAASGISQSHVSKILNGAVTELRPESLRRLTELVNKHAADHNRGLLPYLETEQAQTTHLHSSISALPGHSGDPFWMAPSQGLDRHEIKKDLSACLQIAEHANAESAYRALSGKRVTISGSVAGALNWLNKDSEKAHDCGDLTGQLSAYAATDHTPQRMLRIANWLAGPAIIRMAGEGASSPHFSAVTSQAIQEREYAPCSMFQPVHLVNVGGANLHFASSLDGLSRMSTMKLKSAKLQFIDLPIDIMARTTGFLMAEHGLSAMSAYQMIQWWIRESFGLSYDAVTRRAIVQCVRDMHELFYGNSLVTTSRGRLERSAVVDTEILVSVIQRALQPATAERGGQIAEAREAALGVLLFLRICRLVRPRYRWGINLGEEAPGAVKELDQCVSLMYPFDATFLLARMFGAVSDIPGLDFVFRGGILPNHDRGLSMTVFGNPGSGKTILALELAADIAARGGLAVYLTMEESPNSIAERLDTFNLATRLSFDLLVNSIHPHHQLRLLAQEGRRSGVLVICQVAGFKEVPLKSLLDEIDEAADGRWRRKALVVDNVSSLLFGGEQRDHSYTGVPREQLDRLVKYVEDRRYMGILLAEGDQSDCALAGVSAMVIEMGMQSDRRTRTFEVRKCRHQNFHQGVHTFKIRDGHGVRIYPAASAIRSTLRMRNRGLPSQVRSIDLASQSGTEELEVREKSTALVIGPAMSGKTCLVSQWLYAPTVPVGSISPAAFQELPRGTLAVSFRTNEALYRAHLAHHLKYSCPALNDNARKIANRNLRWFVPGDDFTSEQLLDSIWSFIRQGRRDGAPIDRIAFDEIEAVGRLFPRIHQDDLFWATLVELVTTEPVSTLFCLRGDKAFVDEDDHPLIELTDYVFEARNEEGKSWVKCVKRPPTALDDMNE
jgi:KaiC/GvpD/RAD55 family RecA-like ATPase/transcriptional regulator with XRE-family HTH domain